MLIGKTSLGFLLNHGVTNRKQLATIIFALLKSIWYVCVYISCSRKLWMIVPHSKNFKSLGSTIIEMVIDGKACCMEDIKNLPDISNSFCKKYAHILSLNTCICSIIIFWHYYNLLMEKKDPAITKYSNDLRMWLMNFVHFVWVLCSTDVLCSILQKYFIM